MPPFNITLSPVRLIAPGKAPDMPLLALQASTFARAVNFNSKFNVEVGNRILSRRLAQVLAHRTDNVAAQRLCRGHTLHLRIVGLNEQSFASLPAVRVPLSSSLDTIRVGVQIADEAGPVGAHNGYDGLVGCEVTRGVLAIGALCTPEGIHVDCMPGAVAFCLVGRVLYGVLVVVCWHAVSREIVLDVAGDASSSDVSDGYSCVAPIKALSREGWLGGLDV